MIRPTAIWQAAVAMAVGGVVARGPLSMLAPATWALLALAAMLLARLGRARAVIAVAALGAALSAREMGRATQAQAQWVGVDDREADEVIGVVDGPVQPSATSWGARLMTDAGAVWLWSPMAIQPGDHVRARGRLRSPGRYQNPGAPDRDVRARQRDVSVELSATSITVDGADEAWPWRWADGVRQGWRARIGDGHGAALVRATVLGDRAGLDDATNARWRAAGVFHALSVSGLHLAVVALLLFAALRSLVAASPLGRVGRAATWAAPLSVAMATAYTLITGAEVATVRALVVVVIVLGGHALGRPPRLLDALGMAALLILAWSPSTLADPSFQLSFTAATLFALLPTRAPRDRWPMRMARKLVRAVLASAWVTAATAPITAITFGQVAWGGVVGNVLVTPVLELAVLPLALIALVLAPVAGPVATLLLDATKGLAQLADGLAAVVATRTPMVEVMAPSRLELVLYVVATGALFAAYVGRWRWRRGLVIAMVATAVLVAARLHRDRSRATTTELVVTFVDVGQGDAAIIEVPGGEVWLVDAGGAPGAPTRAAAIAPGVEVARVLRWLGHTRVDVAVVSHPHPDHYLGLLAVSDAMPIGELWAAAEEDPHELPDVAAPGTAGLPTFVMVASQLAARGTLVRAPPLGIARTRAGVELEVLAPRFVDGDGGSSAVATADPVRTVNDNSLVMAITYAGRRVLLLGDVEEEGEDALRATGSVIADVVKVAHHGSRTSSSAALVTATGARVAVVSVGAGNRFGLPRDEVLARWQAAGAQVLRTDRVGAVTVHVDAGGGVRVTTHEAVPP